MQDLFAREEILSQIAPFGKSHQRMLRDFQRIKYTANKNDNHFKGGEKGCRRQPFSPPTNMQDKCLHKESS